MGGVSRKIFSNVLFLGGGQGITWVFASIYVLVIPRYLGPAGIGILTLVGAISSIIYVLANIGTKVFILREAARDPQTIKKWVGPAMALTGGAAILCWLVVILTLNLLHESETVKLVVYISAPASVLSVIIIPMKAALQGLDKMHYTFYEVVFDKGLNTVLALSLAALNFGVVLVATSNLTVIIPLCLLYIWWLFKHTRVSFRQDLGVYKALVRGGLAFLIVDISFNLYLYLDAILLASLTNDTVVGYYSVPTRLFGTLLVAPVIVGQAVLPTLSRMASDRQQPTQATTLSRLTLQFLVCVSMPTAVGITVMAQPLITFFYQSQFAASIPIMILLGWTVVPTYLGVGLYQILTAQGRQVSWSKLMVMALFLNLGLNLGLITYFQSNGGNGGVGAALSLLLTEITIGVFGLRLVGPEIVNSKLVWFALKSLALALFMGLAIWPLREAFLPVPILVGIGVYGLLAVPVFGLAPYLRQGISALKRRVVKKQTATQGVES